MKNKIIIIIIFIFAISCEEQENVIYQVPTEETMEVLVTFVNDGDTFTFYLDNNRYLVRVLEIDCFETFEGDRLRQQAIKAGISKDSALSLGIKAKEFAKELLLNKYVTIKRKAGERNTDIYDRLLRSVVVDGMSYDSIMLTNNLAFPY